MKFFTRNSSKSLHSRLVLVIALALALFTGGAFVMGAGAAQGSESPQAPAATTNVCDLPGAEIDAGDLAYEGDDIQVIGCQGTINGEHTFNNLVVQDGTLVHSAAFTTTTVTGLSLTITGDATIAADGAINVSGRGFPGGVGTDGHGPGGGTASCNNDAGCGGAHAGLGGAAYDYFGNWFGGGVAYGDGYRPVTFGSGGGSCIANAFCGDGYGGAGGGAVHLVVGGTLTLDGGLQADGLAGRLVSNSIPGGGGAGGSIWLDVGTLAGSGPMTANGGAGIDTGRAGMGGGGGRIAVYYDNNIYTGDLSAKAGVSYQQIMGGAGTIYLRDNNEPAGHMKVINRDHGAAAPPPNGSSPLDGGLVTASEPHNFTYFDISGPARVSTSLPVTVSQGSSFAPGLWAIQGSFAGVTTTLGSSLSLSVTSGTASPTVGQLRTYFDGPLNMDASQDLLIGLNGWVELREPLTVDDVIVSSYGRLGHIPYREGSQPKLDLTANTLTIDANGQINVGARGYPGALANSNLPGGGPGGGINSSGGGYGGIGGGLDGGSTYGCPTMPVDLGSGGAGCSANSYCYSPGGDGGAGGGAMYLNIAGALSLEGMIAANGGSTSTIPNGPIPGAGGSGGSVWLETGTLSGAGTILANGGSSPTASGGGGRIALDIANDSFTGQMSVDSGSGGSIGEIGTIEEVSSCGVQQSWIYLPIITR